MAFDAKNLNAYDFIKDFKAKLSDTLQERLESGELFPVLEAKGIPKNLQHAIHSYPRGGGEISFHKLSAEHKKLVHPHLVKADEEWDKNHKGGNLDKHEKHSNNAVKALGLDHKKFHFSPKQVPKVLKEEIENLEENVGKDTTDTDWTVMGREEKDAVLRLRENGRHLGSDEGAYASGVLCLTFKNKQAVEDFANVIENDVDVDTYEIEAVRENLVHGFVEDEEYDFDDIMFDKEFEFNVFIYLNMDLVMFPAEELDVGEEFEWDDDADNGFLTEVRRKIKVNFRGKKRVKMQCSPGFKWVPSMKTCKKISGAQVAVMRKAMRRAVLTKKSMGQSFKARVVRKSRKANRFRKSFGLR